MRKAANIFRPLRLTPKITAQIQKTAKKVFEKRAWEENFFRASVTRFKSLSSRLFFASLIHSPVQLRFDLDQAVIF